MVCVPLAAPCPAVRVWAQDRREHPLAVLGLVMPPEPEGALPSQGAPALGSLLPPP